MAMRATELDRRMTDSPLFPQGAWWAVAVEAVVPIPPDLLDYMVKDTSSWPLWDPGLVGVEPLEGTPGQPGMMCRLTIGNRRWSQPVIQMLVASSDLITVFAGGGRRWYFIETIRLTPRGGASTRIERRVEVAACGVLRWLMVPFTSLVGRHLRRSLNALT